MIDYIRTKLVDKHKMENNLIKEKNKYNVESKYSYSNDEKIYPIRSRVENLYINITKKGGYIENSIHKYFNNLVSNENQNFNDFYFCDVLYALEVLEDEIGYPLEDTILTNLEFGFNIEMDICPSKFLENHVLMHTLKTPCYNPKNDRNMKIKKFTYSEYEIKVYNKTLDHSRYKDFKERLKGTNILRIEVKYKSKKQLNKLGIFNLSDLKKPKSYTLLMQDFLKKYDDLLIIDSYNGNSFMDNKDSLFITHATHPNYWIDLRNNKHSNTVTYQKNKLKKLVKKHELDSWKKQLKRDVLRKFNQLMTLECYGDSINNLNVA